MLRLTTLLFTFSFYLFAQNLSIASYNIENLFDTKSSGKEYPLYRPNNKHGWNKKMLQKKIANIAKVIKVVDADILALQEIENKAVLKSLNLALGVKRYPYMYMALSDAPIQSALLSRYPIVGSKSHKVDKKFRAIEEVQVQIGEKELTLLLNHWPAYNNPSSKRAIFAKKIKKLSSAKKDFIILGDLNAPFDMRDDGWGRSLKLLDGVGKNLWKEVPFKKRYSHSFFGKKNALDHIIISPSLHDFNGLDYIPRSFKHVLKDFMVDSKANPLRWEVSHRGKGKHTGKGFSDHLPIKALFTTDATSLPKLENMAISKLKSLRSGAMDVKLERVMVVDKKYFGVRLEDLKGDQIFAYRPAVDLKLGSVYDLHIMETAQYKKSIEITVLDILRERE